MSASKSDFLFHDLVALSQACGALRGPASGEYLREAVGRADPIVPYREADVTAEIRNRMQRGESLSVIARALNRDGLRAPYGGRWYAASVRAFIFRRQHVS